MCTPRRKAPPARRLDRHRVVEVAGALAVDGEDDAAAQVLAARPVLRLGVVRQGFGGGLDLGREALRDAVVAQHHQHVDPRHLWIAQHLDDAAARRARARHPLDGDDHEVSLRQVVLGAHHLQLDRHLGIERGEPAAALLLDVRGADQGVVAPHEDLHHLGLGQPVAARRPAAERLHQHRVARQRALEVRGGRGSRPAPRRSAAPGRRPSPSARRCRPAPPVVAEAIQRPSSSSALPAGLEPPQAGLHRRGVFQPVAAQAVPHLVDLHPPPPCLFEPREHLLRRHRLFSCQCI